MDDPKYRRNRSLSIVTEDVISPSGQMQSPHRGRDRGLTPFNNNANELGDLKDSTDSNGSRNKASEPSSMDSLAEKYAGNRGLVVATGGNGANNNMGTGHASLYNQSYELFPRRAAPDWSSTPVTPNTPLSEMLCLAIQIGSLQTQNQYLQDRNHELLEELAEYKKKDRGKGGRRSNGPNTPDSRGGSTTGSIRNARSDTGLNAHATPIGTSTPFTPTSFTPTPFTPTSFTPTSFTPQGSAAGPSQMNSGPSNTTRRHERTETPDLSSSFGGPVGIPVHTWGMFPQDDRGLISDFVDQIKSWSSMWTMQGESLSLEKLEAMNFHPAVHGFLPKSTSTDIRGIVTDQDVRCALVAAIVAQDIILTTVCEHFLSNSEHPAAGECDTLFSKYINLGPAEVVAKHDALLAKKALYKKIEEDPAHRPWRIATAKELSDNLAIKLGGLIRDDNMRTRNGTLKDLYIKGYRIGFRIARSVKEWEMCWPTDGDEFNTEVMVNESRNLCGSIVRTVQMVSASPQNYTVRFATSPTVRRHDFSTGSEQETVVHKALVHLSRNMQPIGAGRSDLMSFTFGG